MDKRAYKKVKEQEEQFLQEVFIEMASRIVERTPVQSGRARGNWNASTNKEDVSTSTFTDPSGQSTIASIKNVAYRSDSKDDLYLANGLPYIGVLERGSSTQAPRGMVAITVEEVNQIARDVARRIK